ncbi:D-alanyl-D-alanine carboxypeptidase/D-alanyl-D-alanine-endopeptidase [Virgibacillus sp. SK37]|uniref:D-alanyl-D-alanine carboxypeptidase/D-alanyl-D-alanine endopeptidase n=1 Tax=Virgibacillus sp. SK37 TaxID=403957 RepID=UPI0004D18127|nr:D-alanyl-D-alanine carboxypeptidase/D-alanyl-D-alanine-endopeptidase [Virgibacillus sp. SK37]AIF43966.1 D-alanyl-D-alanine carboxypeptidase [Virgibacillus sp. SK37]
MKAKLENFIANEPALMGALTGISIRDRHNGEVVYERQGETRMHPASNMKLLTAAASLSELGEKYKFITEVKADGEIIDSKLVGNLYLVGKGDPTLVPEDLDLLTEDLRLQGIKEITGDLVADDRWYDLIRLSPDMMWEDEHAYYGGQISALTLSPDEDYDAGTVIIEVAPGYSIGDKPKVTLSPPTDYVRVENNAKTDEVHSTEEEIVIRRLHGTNTITITGNIPLDSPNRKEWVAVWEPTEYVLAVWQHALLKKAIKWSGTVKVAESPTNAKILCTHTSKPISEMLVPFMKLSNNGIGEVLIKEMGRKVYGDGSWPAGLKVLEERLTDYNMKIDNLLLRDGSGISHVSLIPPNEITKLLYHIQKESWFPTYLDSLPVAGKEDRLVGGTLRDRLKGLKLQAKTGTIYGVSTLSGYAEANSGKKYIFSVMLNNMLDEEIGKEIEDRMLEIILKD